MEEIVRRTGLTPRAIRYYEEMGLLSPSGRTAGGFRLFTDAEIAQLLRIKELQTLLGFSLAEIKETLQADAARAEIRQAYQQATDPATRLGLIEQATSLAQTRVRIINERMARLTKLQEEVEQSLARLSARHEQLLRELAEQQPNDNGQAHGQVREKP
ncbi:MAG TPA: MerR family transcriptional regulator [bacterium]|nr:MerR family transcriptional regulator [bacterium]